MHSTLFDDGFFLIAGPCVLEDDALNLDSRGRRSRSCGQDLGLPHHLQGLVRQGQPQQGGRSARARVWTQGCAQLERVKRETGLPVLTDVHEAAAVRGGRRSLRRAADPGVPEPPDGPVVAAARTGRALNIKKGQWMAPEDMRGAVDKARAGGCAAVSP